VCVIQFENIVENADVNTSMFIHSVVSYDKSIASFKARSPKNMV
jgi:hypothetical protein